MLCLTEVMVEVSLHDKDILILIWIIIVAPSEKRRGPARCLNLDRAWEANGKQPLPSLFDMVEQTLQPIGQNVKLITRLLENRIRTILIFTVAPHLICKEISLAVLIDWQPNDIGIISEWCMSTKRSMARTDPYCRVGKAEW
ncbi:hypothetical protein Adt_04114 [Abeliophyllum distichum]|uniref:Uncharacterized protein n=1 Tax=Abeliophyllum distichum TaxID=126358 RepID=A0ABD1W0F3_9LAMI